MGVERPGMSTALIAFGGNLGEVRETFLQARSDLANSRDISVTAISKLYRTPPLGPPGQPDYFNAVISIETRLAPLALLKRLQRIENSHGRVRGERWGARTLDLDIIAYAGETCDSEYLTLPHPRIAERMFVLRPLCDIDPAWQHPLLKATAAELMQRLIDKGEPPLPEGEAW